ncbi:MAG TPA: multiheme c-type cytochrome [Polyangiaceae bacterium]|nr:multiheme c-type cytochrome [Polyangiaceae bacterium]
MNRLDLSGLGRLRAASALALAACLGTACSTPEKSGERASVDRSDAGHPQTGPETDCASCHPQQVAEWKVSSHAYSMKDPVFHAMVKLGQEETQGELGDFCVKCHSPIGNRSGETTVSADPATGIFSQKTTGLDTAAMDGVSCIVCHSMTNVSAVSNAGFDLGSGATMFGPIRNPDRSPVHEAELSALFEDTEMCGTCHVVLNPRGVALERTHIEWVESIFNGSKTCQDCHMPSSKGPAAVGHGERTLHDHRFVGVDVSLLPPAEFPGYDDFRDRVGELLRGTTKFDVHADEPGRRLAVDIQNLAGHSLPSGATADREVWVEAIVKNAAGDVVFESGTPDERGDLRVAHAERTTKPGTDPQLILYSQEMFLVPKDAEDAAIGEPALVDFLWQPNQETSHLIRAEEIAHRGYDLSALPDGAYTATVRLLFRSFPPHLLRRLEAEADLSPDVAPRVPTVEMASASASFRFGAN